MNEEVAEDYENKIKENKMLKEELIASKAEVERLREALKRLSEMPEYDQDDAHRLRHGAKLSLNQINK